MTLSASSASSAVLAERRLTGSLLFLLAGLAAIGALATNIILPAFPRIGASLGVSPRELGLTLSSFFIAFAIGQLAVGPLSDCFGRRWLVLGGLGVFAAGSVVCAFADSLPMLVVGRVVQALGGRLRRGAVLHVLHDRDRALSARNGAWAFLFRRDAKLKEMGLGGVTSVTLADARLKADEARRVLADGRNPIEVRRAVAESPVAPPAAPTFGEFMDSLIEEISPGFRNAKHIQQWRNSMRDYAAPLRSKRCDEVDTKDILAILQPIWTKKADTASRVRGRLERVLDAATRRGCVLGRIPLDCVAISTRCCPSNSACSGDIMQRCPTLMYRSSWRC
jgi:hypothetical protein